MPTSNWKGSTYKAGIYYDIENLEDSIGNQFVVGANTVSIFAFVDWDYRNYFVQDMLGHSFMLGTPGTSSRQMIRVLPEQCPFLLDNNNAADLFGSLYAASCELVKSVTWRNNTAPNDWPKYTKAVYKVTFASVLYPVLGEDQITSEKDRYTIFTPRGESKEEKIPGGGYKFADGTARVVQEVGTLTGRLVKLECKWLDVPEIPYSNLLLYSNKVNDDVLTLDGVDYVAETVLFENWAALPRMSPLGKKTYDLTYNFLIRSDGRSWNKFWNTTAAKAGFADPYTVITSDGTTGGTKPYITGPIQKIFQFAP
jgi:hypothetical protein